MNTTEQLAITSTQSPHQLTQNAPKHVILNRKFHFFLGLEGYIYLLLRPHCRLRRGHPSTHLIPYCPPQAAQKACP